MTAHLGKKRRNFAESAMKIPRIRKAFEDAWYLHARMFGELIEPAFKDDIASRFELVAVLNLLSRREALKAMPKLTKLFRYCRNDADLAAWFYFMGVCCERLGMLDRATVMYFESAKKEPQSYMVYLSLAKRLHAAKQYELAVSCYMHTLELLGDSASKDTVPMIKPETLSGSVHGNMAACLVMMRSYNEAEYELYEAESLGFDPPMLNLSWAILYAATDRRAMAKEKLALLREELPEAESRAVLTVEEILVGKNPHFCLQKIDTKKLEDFWQWFSENEERLRIQLSAMPEGQPFSELHMRLYESFGYKDETVNYIASRDGDKIALGFLDGFSITYEIWLERLVDTAPAGLKENWSFYAAH